MKCLVSDLKIDSKYIIKHPLGVFYDRTRKRLYITSTGNRTIFSIDPDKGDTKILFGNMKEVIYQSPSLFFPTCIACDETGESIIVSDLANNNIKGVSLDNSELVYVIAGSKRSYYRQMINGKCNHCLFNTPIGICFHPDGCLIVADSEHHKIRRIDIENNLVSTISGSTRGYKDGHVSEARFSNPSGLTVSKDGTMYVCDTNNNCIRMIDNNKKVSTIEFTNTFTNTITTYVHMPNSIITSKNRLFLTHFEKGYISIIKNARLSRLDCYRKDIINGRPEKEEIKAPSGLAFIDDNTLITADYEGNRLVKIELLYEVDQKKSEEENM